MKNKLLRSIAHFLLCTTLLLPTFVFGTAHMQEENPESYVEFSGEKGGVSLFASSPTYKLTVDVINQVVCAYTVSGSKETLIRQMICSTGKNETPTPLGSFAVSSQYRWGYFSKFDCWAQYWSRFNGAILFHSVLYDKQDVNTLIKSSVTNLGKRASHGCVRLQVSDAKWIYDNCSRGTKVVVFEGKKDAKYTAAVKKAGMLQGSNLYYPSAPEPSIGKGTIKTSGGSVNLREKASTSSAKLTSIPNKTVVEVVRIEGDWVRVNYAGYTGYVSKPYISLGSLSTDPDPEPEKPSGTTVKVVTSGGSLNMRSQASTSASVLAAIPNGTTLEVVQVLSDWVQVRYKGATGYISKAYTSLKNQGGSTTPDPTPPSTLPIAKGTIQTSGSLLNMRSKPNTSASIVTRIPNKTSVNIYAYSNGWAQIQYSGKTGYVSLSYLKVTSGQKP